MTVKAAPGPPRARPASSQTIQIDTATQLDAAAILAVAVGTNVPDPSERLLAAVDARRRQMLEMLASGFQVCGVHTGMGALSEVRPDADALSDHQESLILACWVGGRPG